MAQQRFDARGVVETHTTEEVTAEGFAPPVHLGVVRIADGQRGKTPVRVMVRSKKALKVGATVHLEVDGEVVWATAA